MHSLRWLGDKVARASPPSIRNTNQADTQNAKLPEDNDHNLAQGDAANGLHRSDGESQSRARPRSFDDGKETFKTAPIEPKTPATKQPSRIPRWTGDSGYDSASNFKHRHHRSTEDLLATPTKIVRRMSLALSNEHWISPDLDFSLQVADADQEQSSGRDRHDSVLSSHVPREVGNKKARRNDDQNESKALSPFPALDHVSSRILPVIGCLHQQSDHCFQKLTIIPSICDSEVSRSPSSASKKSVASSEIKSTPTTCREKLNSRFELRVSGDSPFWRVGDGVDEPKILQQVSCLQCILKKLPCDQKLPQCSRCVRSGHGPCLVQRDLLAEERWKAGLWGNNGSASYSVLVQLKSDDEGTWTVKKALEASMLAYLAEQHDQRNWVVPKSDGNLGLYKKELHGKKPKYLLDYARGHFL